MEQTALWAFVAVVILAGAGVGFLCQAKVAETHQNVKMPSLFSK